jgi:hypothetical protein
MANVTCLECARIKREEGDGPGALCAQHYIDEWNRAYYAGLPDTPDEQRGDHMRDEAKDQ